MTYDIGDRPTLDCTMRDDANVGVDPTTLVFTMREPDGTLTTYIYGTDTAVVRDGVGQYHVDWDILQPGTHWWRFTASGNIGTAEESSFDVRVSQVLTPGQVSCGWPVDRGCLPALPDPDDEDYDDKVAARNNNENVAVSVLWALTGRQFGCRAVTVRPEPPASHGICDDGPLIEAYYRNDWRGLPYGKSTPRSVVLAGPVSGIVTVTIDGEELDEDEYALEGDTLYRRGQAWPRNNMTLPAGDVGTWSVTYLKGTPAPAYVGKFVGLLAAEMITACEDGKRCRLPRTVVSTSRSGVTHVFDPTRMLAAGFTGIPEIDTWIAAVNPANLSRTASVR